MEIKKKYNYDKKADVLFVCLKEGVEDSFEEIVPGVNVELDSKGDVIGIEILNVSRFGKAFSLKNLA